MLWSEYQGIDQLVLKTAFIQTHGHMSVHTDDRVTETKVFDQGVRKYVRVTATRIFDQVYVTDYKCNWPLFRVGLMRVTILVLDIKYTFSILPPVYERDITLLSTYVSRYDAGFI